MPLGDGRYRFTGGAAGEEPAKDRPVTFEEIAEMLRIVYGEQTVLDTVDNASRFGDATRQIDSYRVGNAFFAGDAAHIHPPFGGQGLNLGVQDAFNLGWKMAAVLRGRAPTDLLDTYHAERHPAGAWVLHITQAQRVFADPRPSADVIELRKVFTDLMRLPEANRHLAGLMSGLSHSYDLPGDHPLAGHRVAGLDPSLFQAGKPVLLTSPRSSRPTSAPRAQAGGRPAPRDPGPPRRLRDLGGGHQSRPGRPRWQSVLASHEVGARGGKATPVSQEPTRSRPTAGAHRPAHFRS